jgi:hypothetical protein
MAGDAATPEQIDRIRAEPRAGPLHPRAVRHLVRPPAHGRPRASRTTSRCRSPRSSAQRLEPTLSLALIARSRCRCSWPCRWVWWPPGATAAGSTAASWPSRCWASRCPVFVAAYLLIWLVSLKLGWLPVQGYKRLADGAGPWLYHLVLPAITLSLIYIALIARVTRASRAGEPWARTTSAPRAPRAARAGRAAPPRAGQRGRAHRHGGGHRRGAAHRRGGGNGVGVRHTRPGPVDRGRRARARLPHHPGRHPLLLGGLRAGEPAGATCPTCSSTRASATDAPDARRASPPTTSSRSKPPPIVERPTRLGARAAQPVGAHRRLGAARARGRRAGRALARHGGPFPLRPGQPRPAARADGRDHHAGRRDPQAPLPHGLGRLRSRRLQPRHLRHEVSLVVGLATAVVAMAFGVHAGPAGGLPALGSTAR